jgi:hypothetical protein
MVPGLTMDPFAGPGGLRTTAPCGVLFAVMANNDESTHVPRGDLLDRILAGEGNCRPTSSSAGWRARGA